MASIGLSIAAEAVLDNALAVAAGSAIVDGGTRNLGAAPQPPELAVSFQVGKTGANNATQLEVYVLWANDGATWPDSSVESSQAEYLGLVYNAATGAGGVTRSNQLTFRVKAQHYRFRYRNLAAVDALTVTSRVAPIHGHSA